MSDRHLRLLRKVARQRRARLRANEAERHAEGSPGAARGDDLARSSAVADARLAAAAARRARSDDG